MKPVYVQAATEFCDLHDKTGRMKAKGVIKSAVPWERSREFFYYRAKRRIVEDDYVKQLQQSDASLDSSAAMEMLKSMCTADFEDNHAVIDFYEANESEIADKIKTVKVAAVEAQIEALKKELE